jgi:hypothetical protein
MSCAILNTRNATRKRKKTPARPDILRYVGREQCKHLVHLFLWPTGWNRCGYAIRYGWAMQNPIAPVRISTKRLRDPEFHTPEELLARLKRLPQRGRAMDLLDASTRLRWGELGPSSSSSDCCWGEAEKGSTVRLPQLPARTGELAGQSRNGRKNGSRTTTPLERFHHARAVCSPGEFVDDGRVGLDDAGVTARIEGRSIGV